jgi:hypothetical protein
MNKILRVLIRIPFREISIFLTGIFSGCWLVAFWQENLLAETYAGIGIIISSISVIFHSFHSNKSHEEKEMIKQLKNAKKIVKEE